MIMKKFFAILFAIIMSISLAACSGSSTVDEINNTPVEETIQLEPNLQRLQGNWAASENYNDEYISFECAQPASYDKDRKGYYFLTIENDKMIYKMFSKGKYNGDPGKNYNAYIFEFVYEIEKVTEIESDEIKRVFIMDAIRDGEAKQISFVVFDKFENLTHTGFSEFMFVKLDQSQYNLLMDVLSDIEHEISNSQELEPYIGMPKAQLKNSTWGTPKDINITETKNNVHEQWCYSGGRYVYVDNGYVSSIQKY